MRRAICFISAAIIFTGCASLQESSKYGFREGYYKSRLYHKKIKQIYVVPGDDSIKVYSAKTLRDNFVDTVSSLKMVLPANKRPAEFRDYSFHQNSFDVDVLSILFKYRPKVKGFPNQLNTSILNGAAYFGYRTDVYKLFYKTTPLRVDRRKLTHYGFSYGVFTGIGASRVDEYVTRGALNIEYDGFVNVAGIAAIVAVNKLSFGIDFGFDHLLDHNRSVWIYQGKPWIGLSAGLNLN